ncbi:MAG: D-alanine--D-alanine ligase family protein [Bacilli bacterium]|jgi:D-alanine-D-alanine ligase
MKIKIGVIFGGQTVEHEVSIISAIQAMKAIDLDKYEVIPIYISKEKEWYTGNLLKDIDNYQDLDNLKRYAKRVVLYNDNGRFVLQNKSGFRFAISEIDIAFPIVHGVNVEDGTLHGYLEMVGIPYIGCDIYGGVVGQDKIFMKQILETSKIPIPKYVWFFDSEYQENKSLVLEKIKKLKFPVILKPSRLGSSVGINIVTDINKLEEAIEDTLQYDPKVVVEEMVENLIEVNCSVLGNYTYQQTSELEEVMSSEEFLTYQDKYLGSTKGGKSEGMASTNRVLPARIDDKLRKEVRDLAKDTFKVLNASGVCRIDFLIDKKKKKVYVNEINTIPGSLSFYLWEPVGKSYTSLIEDLVSLAIKNHKRKNKLIFSFETNILKFHGGLKGNKNKLKS